MVLTKHFGKLFQSKDESQVLTSTEQTVNRFDEALKRVESSEFLEASSPYSFFDGRPIIGQSTPINGGVFLGALPHEAIVVDDSHGELEKAYTELMIAYAKDHPTQKSVGTRILPYIAELVQKLMQFSPERVRTGLAQNGIFTDHKVSLDFFLIQEVGAARHQMLLAAYLIERLIMRGYLKGSLEIQAEFSFEEQNQESLIYKDDSGEEFTIDPIQFRHGESLNSLRKVA